MYLLVNLLMKLTMLHRTRKDSFTPENFLTPPGMRAPRLRNTAIEILLYHLSVNSAVIEEDEPPIVDTPDLPVPAPRKSNARISGGQKVRFFWFHLHLVSGAVTSG